MTDRVRCSWCSRNRDLGRTTCLHCGAALLQGREPTAQEQYMTSEAFRLARLERIQEDRTYNEHKDDIVLAVISQLQDLAEFTWDDLVRPTGFPASALKHHLDRLEARGCIKKVGVVKIHQRTRWRPVYQRLFPAALLSADTAPSDARTQPAVASPAVVA
jgi:hypothetical protein